VREASNQKSGLRLVMVWLLTHLQAALQQIWELLAETAITTTVELP